MDFKKNTPALLISLAAHAAFLGFFWFWLQARLLHPSGISGGVQWIEIGLASPKTSAISPGKILKNLGKSAISAVGTIGDGGGNGSSEILRAITLQIERKKYYPLNAKRSGVEGSPTVSFQIKNDGTLAYVQIQKSSGYLDLDKAALNSVRQAAPFPHYSEPIALVIHYSLNP